MIDSLRDQVDGLTRLLATERDAFGKKETELKGQLKRAKQALRYIKDHSVPPFTNEKWVREINEVATEALK